MSVHHRLPTQCAAAYRRGVDPGDCGRLVRDAANPSFVDGLFGGWDLRSGIVTGFTRPDQRCSAARTLVW
jgi:hypothetical protein